MKKIGILTVHYPHNTNFGASLQSFACMKMIEKYGKLFNNDNIEVKIINYIPNRPNKMKERKLRNIYAKGFYEYNEKFLSLTKEIYDETGLEELNKEIDIFVVGSDQVWRNYSEEIAKKYFFNFVKDNKRKIAYAPSFGLESWNEKKEYTEEIKKLIKRFDFVSVREESGVEICKNIFERKDAVCVLDPTLMVDKNEYNIILDDYRDKSHKNKKYIAYMLLDDNKNFIKEAKNIAKKLNCDLKNIKGYKNFFTKLFSNKPIYNSVSQWLNYLKDSELVITDSFHCTVFSIIFNKKFIVVANENRGVTRLKNLLSKLGLENRLFYDISEVKDSTVLFEEINYKNVEEKLEKLRENSIKFLKEALK